VGLTFVKCPGDRGGGGGEQFSDILRSLDYL
jgi:hypothetical protein